MKKRAVLIAAAMCPFSAFAVNGPYVGVGLCYSNTIFDVYQDATATAFSTTERSWKSFHGITGGIQTQLAIGYACDINKFRLGAEITAQMPKTTYTDSEAPDKFHTYEFIHAYGVNFVPGYYITNRNLLYLKIGARRGKFAYKDFPSAEYPILNTSFYSTGLNLGLGTEMYLTKNIRLKLEYFYTNYTRLKFISNLALPENITVVVDSRIQPHVHTVMLGVDYQFDFLN